MAITSLGEALALGVGQGLCLPESQENQSFRL